VLRELRDGDLVSVKKPDPKSVDEKIAKVAQR
jgi:hypothetical protein